MSIKLGIYDFFAYTIPGIFYLLVGVVVLALFGVIDLNTQTVNDLSLAGAIVLAAALCAGLSLLAARQGLKFKRWYYDATFKAAAAEAMRVEDLFEQTPRFAGPHAPAPSDAADAKPGAPSP